ncbi:MAG: glucose-1-phosphate adenylyltransferase subunit GlgD [Clostridiales bacterium]|nr:glucose-1-phosphate adenylyltransferase subunit GlgD [Clostridiales bacterium]
MRRQDALGLLFSNMHDDCLMQMTNIRAFGSIPFGGRYRLIDFPLSNMVNAGISKVGVITKNNYQSLMDHIGSGKAWDLSRKNEGLYFLPPHGAGDQMYAGRIASLLSITPFLRNSREEYVIMSDCHVVGNIDYELLLQAHIDSGAEITIGYQRREAPPISDALTLQVARDGRVNDIRLGYCHEGCECDFGLGLYVMRKDLLMSLTSEAASRNQMSFERDVLQQRCDMLRIVGYRVPEYTAVITSLDSYFRANLELLRPGVRASLFPVSRPIYTKVRDCSPALYGLHASVSNSLVADGASIDGIVTNSVIFRDVHIDKNTRVENCVIMQGSLVGERSELGCVVMDKDVAIRDGRTLRGFDSYPLFINKGSVV